MRVCLMVEGQEGVSWEQWLALGEACERAGLEGLFRSDHYTSIFDPHARGSLDAWATLAALAARTERIRLGTMVSPATFRHPSQLARVAATVEELLAAGPTAAREAKALIRRLRGQPGAQARALTVAAIARQRASAEGQEGLAAFLEKRDPSWRSRPD